LYVTVFAGSAVQEKDTMPPLEETDRAGEEKAAAGGRGAGTGKDVLLRHYLRLYKRQICLQHRPADGAVKQPRITKKHHAFQYIGTRGLRPQRNPRVFTSGPPQSRSLPIPHTTAFIVISP
jgi:hypothetical protein